MYFKAQAMDLQSYHSWKLTQSIQEGKDEQSVQNSSTQISPKEHLSHGIDICQGLERTLDYTDLMLNRLK